MKRVFCVLIVLSLMFTFPSCQSGQDEVYSQITGEIAAREENSSSAIDYDNPTYIGPGKDELHDLEAVPDDHLSGELVIKQEVYQLNQTNIYFLVQEFMQLHPKVTIRFEYDRDRLDNHVYTLQEQKQRKEKFYEQVRMELVSGEADYLLFNVGEDLDLVSFSQNGLLTDMRPYWDSDPDIQENDFYTNVLEAFEVDGKMTMIPIAFTFDGVYFNRTLLQETGTDPESIRSVNSDDILDWYEQVRENHEDLNLFFTSPGKDRLFPMERIRYMDLETGKASFDSPEFLRFLERTAAARNEDPELDPKYGIAHGTGAVLDEKLSYEATGKIAPDVLYITYQDPENDDTGRMYLYSEPSFSSVDEIGSFEVMDLCPQREYVAGPYPVTSTDGKLPLSSREDFAVPASCSNKELAWEFIKYCLATREADQMDFSYLGLGTGYSENIAVNKTNFRQLAEDMCQNSPKGFLLGYPDFHSADVEAIVKRVDEILTLPLVNKKEYGLGVQEYLDEFYLNELTTAKECAEKIQGRAEIWLNE